MTLAMEKPPRPPSSLSLQSNTTADQDPSGKGQASQRMTPLSDDFVPGEDDVICGRGKKCYNHVGNDRFRRRVMLMLDEYSCAKSKLDKSGVLSRVVDQVRRASPSGGFVKQDESGRWFEVGDFLAREKTSQAFRDALHERYKSSTASKKKRRQREQTRVVGTAQRIAHAEMELSSRLERLTTELAGVQNPSMAMEMFPRDQIEALLRINETASRRSHADMRHPGAPLHMNYRRTPDPLFGTSRMEQFAAPLRTRSEQPIPAAPLLLEPVESPMHHSMPNMRYRDLAEMRVPFSFTVDRDRSSMHSSLPNLDYFRFDPSSSHTRCSDIEPLPLEINRPPNVMRTVDEDQVPNVRPSLPLISDSIRYGMMVESTHSQKDLFSALAKMSDHTLSEGNPFEPIPIKASTVADQKPAARPSAFDPSPAAAAAAPEDPDQEAKPKRSEKPTGTLFETVREDDTSVFSVEPIRDDDDDDSVEFAEG